MSRGRVAGMPPSGPIYKLYLPVCGSRWDLTTCRFSEVRNSMSFSRLLMCFMAHSILKREWATACSSLDRWDTHGCGKPSQASQFRRVLGSRLRTPQSLRVRFRPSWPFTPLPRFSCLLPHHPWRFSLFADRVRDVARRQKGRAVRFLERLVVLLVTVMEALTRGWELIDLTLWYWRAVCSSRTLLFASPCCVVPTAYR